MLIDYEYDCFHDKGGQQLPLKRGSSKGYSRANFHKIFFQV